MAELIGRIYEDPEGIWEIVNIDNGCVDIKNVQDGNVNKGNTFAVSLEEVLYYVK